MSDYAECPKCGEFNPFLAPYYECQICNYLEKKYRSINKVEKKQRGMIRKIIYSLVPKELVEIKFPEKTPDPYEYGETIPWKDKFIISIPRKTNFLSHREMVDTAVHEVEHVFTWEELDTNLDNDDKTHGPIWYWRYRKSRQIIFSKKDFEEFINSPNPQQRFQKSYKIYPSIYIYRNKLDYVLVKKKKKKKKPKS